MYILILHHIPHTQFAICTHTFTFRNWRFSRYLLYHLIIFSKCLFSKFPLKRECYTPRNTQPMNVRDTNYFYKHLKYFLPAVGTKYTALGCRSGLRSGRLFAMPGSLRTCYTTQLSALVTVICDNTPNYLRDIQISIMMSTITRGSTLTACIVMCISTLGNIKISTTSTISTFGNNSI